MDHITNPHDLLEATVDAISMGQEGRLDPPPFRPLPDDTIPHIPYPTTPPSMGGWVVFQDPDAGQLGTIIDRAARAASDMVDRAVEEAMRVGNAGVLVHTWIDATMIRTAAQVHVGAEWDRAIQYHDHAPEVCPL